MTSINTMFIGIQMRIINASLMYFIYISLEAIFKEAEASC